MGQQVAQLHDRYDDDDDDNDDNDDDDDYYYDDDRTIMKNMYRLLKHS